MFEDDPLRNLARASEIALTVPSNSQSKYSNLAFQLLGEIVGRVSGTPYPRYIRERILRPLKMTSTSLDPLSARLSARRAIGYGPRFLSDEVDLAPEEVSIFGAEGGLWSCVEDLARWLSCQLSDEPGALSRATLDEMHRPRYLADDSWTVAWGIGWYARRRDDMIWITHSGGHYGFTSNVCFDPKSRVGAIVLLNGVGIASDLALQLGAIACDEVRSTPPLIDVPPPLPAEWRPYLGLYLFPHFGTVVRVEWLDGKLTVLDPDDPEWKPTLAPTDEPDAFLVEPGVRESGEIARFERDRDGKVTSLFLAAGRLPRLEPVP